MAPLIGRQDGHAERTAGLYQPASAMDIAPAGPHQPQLLPPRRSLP